MCTICCRLWRGSSSGSSSGTGHRPQQVCAASGSNSEHKGFGRAPQGAPAKGSGSRGGGGKKVDVQQKEKERLTAFRAKQLVADDSLLEGGRKQGFSASELFLKSYSSTVVSDAEAELSAAEEQLAAADSNSARKAAGAALQRACDSLESAKRATRQYQQASIVQSAKLDLAYNERMLRSAEAGLEEMQLAGDAIIANSVNFFNTFSSSIDTFDLEGMRAELTAATGNLATAQLLLNVYLLELSKTQSSQARARAADTRCAANWRRLDRESALSKARLEAVERGLEDTIASLVLEMPPECHKILIQYRDEIKARLAKEENSLTLIALNAAALKGNQMYLDALGKREAALRKELLDLTAQSIASAATSGNAVKQPTARLPDFGAESLAGSEGPVPTDAVAATEETQAAALPSPLSPQAAAASSAAVPAPALSDTHVQTAADAATQPTAVPAALVVAPAAQDQVGELLAAGCWPLGAEEAPGMPDLVGDMLLPDATTLVVTEVCAEVTEAAVAADCAASELGAQAAVPAEATVGATVEAALEVPSAAGTLNGASTESELRNPQAAVAEAGAGFSLDFNQSGEVAKFADVAREFMAKLPQYYARDAELKRLDDTLSRYNFPQQARHLQRSVLETQANTRSYGAALKQDMRRAATSTDSERRQRQREEAALKIDELVTRGHTGLSRKTATIMKSLANLQMMEALKEESNSLNAAQIAELEIIERCLQTPR